MNNKKISAPAVGWFCGVLLLTAFLRGMNIWYSAIYSDVTYSDVLVVTVGIVHDVLLLAVYGLSLSFIVYAGREKGKRTALKAALAFTLIVFADRLFCLVYDLVLSNISYRDKNTLLTAITWLGIDVLYLAITYFAAALISPVKEGRRETSFFRPVFLSSLVLTALKLISQISVCISFISEYDDITTTEYAQMLGDLLLVILKYTFGVAFFAAVGYVIIDRVLFAKEKNATTD